MRKRNRKSKHLKSIIVDHVNIRISCNYNPYTDNPTIVTNFYKSGNGGIKTNNKCGIWLGIHVAEQVLSKVFKNFQRMPTNNPGYDFICGKNYKIDVKSSCLVKNKLKTWTFVINKNIIANYFLCLAFDNRGDLNPLHIWLIPSNILNHKVSTSISESTLYKWSQYEQSLDKVLTCCNTMKKLGP